MADEYELRNAEIRRYIDETMDLSSDEESDERPSTSRSHVNESEDEDILEQDHVEDTYSDADDTDVDQTYYPGDASEPSDSDTEVRQCRKKRRRSAPPRSGAAKAGKDKLQDHLTPNLEREACVEKARTVTTNRNSLTKSDGSSQITMKG
ncbi:hypothetical protein J6590_025739 [Homalodisca vitripennis]|nr:hypothetical protein J6590_025739 [Homalodisca vitripennis]